MSEEPFLYRTFGNHVLRPVLRPLYRVKIDGAHRIPRDGPVILAANHESMIDPFVLGLVTPRVIRYMTKAELWRSRILGGILAKSGCFPIERGRGDEGSIDQGRSLLEQGEVLGIFPQGTCLPYRRRPFLRGAARLALAAGAPIVPICLVGTERALRPHKHRIGLPRIRILVAPPIEVAAAKPTLAAARELMRRVEGSIADLRAPYGPPAHVWID